MAMSCRFVYASNQDKIQTQQWLPIYFAGTNHLFKVTAFQLTYCDNCSCSLVEAKISCISSFLGVGVDICLNSGAYAGMDGVEMTEVQFCTLDVFEMLMFSLLPPSQTSSMGISFKLMGNIKKQWGVC